MDDTQINYLKDAGFTLIWTQAKKSNTNRDQFILQKFKDIIKDDDDYEYGQKNNKKKGTIFNRGNLNNDDDEDFDYI